MRRNSAFLSRAARLGRVAAVSYASLAWCVALVCAVGGCAGRRADFTDELTVRDAIESYQTGQVERLAGRGGSAAADGRKSDAGIAPSLAWANSSDGIPGGDESDRPFTLGTLTFTQAGEAQSQPAEGSERAAKSSLPEGYWREDIWHQMGHEALDLGKHDFWKGFKTAYWNAPNIVLLTATFGGSLAIQGTGVDATVRERTRHHRQLGDMDESIQLMGNPGTHFAATGVLWLTSALLKDAKEHEVAKALTQALAVNGVSTILLKAAANTRSPDNEHFGWPSGHTSSAFTVAAVLNEYYGPLAGVPSFALAGLVGYQRLDSRVHDFSDVVFGAMMGYVIGSSIAREDKAQFPELFGMKVIPYTDPETGTSGLALWKQW